MPLIAKDWTVVVIGFWNRAILTPSWVATKLIGLPEGTPINVLVPMDVIGPVQISHDDIVVIPSSGNLVIQATKCNYPTLRSAMTVATNTLTELPRTPVSAAGYNVRFRCKDAVGQIEEVLTSDWDNRISDEKITILERKFIRTLEWRDGTIKLFVTHEPKEGYELLFNFELVSNDQSKLRNWLGHTEADIKEVILMLLNKVFQIQEMEINYD